MAVESASAAVTTTMLAPSNLATVSGTDVALNASADPAASAVQFILSPPGNGQEIANATSTSAGWVATWDSTSVSNGTYTLWAVATINGSPNFSQSITITVDNPPPTTAVVVPFINTVILGKLPVAAVSGNQVVLDATASQGVTSVSFEMTETTPVSGPTQVIATAVPTLYGWIALWNSTSVTNGFYNLQSVASYAGGVSNTSPAIDTLVSNAGPTTAVVVPFLNLFEGPGIPPVALVGGLQVVLDATASPGVSSVTFELTSGSTQVIATATPTYYGWIALWNSLTVPDGSYTLQSVASYPNGVSNTSPGLATYVFNSPTVITPPESSYVNGSNVTLEAVAGPAATSVYFSFTPEDGTPGSPFQIAATFSNNAWYATWNTTSLANGDRYDLLAVATYPGGFTRTSYDYGPTGYILINGN